MKRITRSIKITKPVAIVATLVLIHANSNAENECMATLAASQRSAEITRVDDQVIATVKAGEHFLATAGQNHWWHVYLKSGIDGFIPREKLRLVPNEPVMKLNYAGRAKLWKKWQAAPDADLGETASAAKGRGVNYYRTLVEASNGDMKALARFFALAEFMDGGAAEGYYPDQWMLLHVVGDETFARFLAQQPASLAKDISGSLAPGNTEPISKPKPYLKRYFPKTYRALFRAG